MMKRINLFLMCFFLMGLCTSTMAQERNRTGAERNPEEMSAKMAERLADEFKLKDEARAGFISLYTNYQQDMGKYRFAEMQKPETSAKKDSEMTDEEALARIQTELDRKAQSIVDMYNRLEVEKKYYEEFSKTLSPKQLMKIFAPIHNPRGARSMPARGGRQGERMSDRGFGGGQGGFGDGDDW